MGRCGRVDTHAHQNGRVCSPLDPYAYSYRGGQSRAREVRQEHSGDGLLIPADQVVQRLVLGGRMSPHQECRRVWLYQSTHSMLANSTSSRDFHGPRGRMSSVL